MTDPSHKPELQLREVDKIFIKMYHIVMSLALDTSVFLLYGPPCSGKTTIAEECSSRLSASYISLGKIVRGAIKKKTREGLLLKKYLDAIVEYPPELIATMVKKSLRKEKSRGSKKIFIDGFPKYAREVNSFVEMIQEENLLLSKIIVFYIPISIMLKRVRGRRICTRCLKEITILNSKRICSCGGTLIVREDDSPTVLRRRFKDFKASISSIEQAFQHRCKIVTIDATQPIHKLVKKLYAEAK